jgi:hypothetical protein
LLRNYQIYSGWSLKEPNQEEFEPSVYLFLPVIKDQVPMLTLNTEGLTTMTIIIG